MTSWQKRITRVIHSFEDRIDRLKYRLRKAGAGKRRILIQPYLGFCTAEVVYLKGRVLEDRGITPASEDDTIWDNLANMYRRFESDEIPFARVRARYENWELEAQADEEGFFEVLINDASPRTEEGGGKKTDGRLKTEDGGWQKVELELLEPVRQGRPVVRNDGEVLAISSRAQYGVISDIDDTILRTHATSLLRMAAIIFLNNARTRQPFEGVAAFYQALQKGRLGEALNPIFYVSSSPWNLYDLLVEFLHIQGIPLGPMISLRDWGITKNELLPTGHRKYKLEAIRRILELIPSLPFLLIGDSGQEDPEIYDEIVKGFPGRILVVYIREVSKNKKRSIEIERLKKQISDAGSELILAEDTPTMARQAARRGWIVQQAEPGGN